MLKRFILAVPLLIIGLSEMAKAVEGPVLVFGGTSGTGLAAVQNLRAMDVSVTVFVRPTSNVEALEPLGVKTVVGNALNADDINGAYETGEYRIVISSLGGRRGERRPDLVGNLNITEAAKEYGVKRVIQISSMGAGSTREPPQPGANFSWASRSGMANVLYIKTLAEDNLIASGLDYTIIRPGGLRRGEATGTGVLGETEQMGSIDRQELGRLVVGIIDDDSTHGKILYAWDPELSAQQEQ